MGDGAQEPAALVNQTINWLVGLSGAAIGGALLKFDWLLKLRSPARIAFSIAAFFFLASILFGVFYAFQMLAVGRRQTQLDHASADYPPDEGRINDAQGKFDAAWKKARNYHLGTMITFALAGICTLIVLGIALLPPQPAAKETETLPNKYLMTTSQVYVRGKLSHTHTFLLNQQTGEIWEMRCAKDETVEFRRVDHTKADGTIETEPNPIANNP